MFSPIKLLISIIVLSGQLLFAQVTATEHTSKSNKLVNNWFNDFKSTASDKDLYSFLYNMPKGADLHNHASGSNFPRWWYELATNHQINGGYRYYTKVNVNLCEGYGKNAFGGASPHLLFVNISQNTYENLSACQKKSYKLLSKLTSVEKQAWLKSLWLDKKYEGRNEFFETHWQRLNELSYNPYIAAEMLVKNIKSFSNEGLIYLETQFNVNSFYTSQGKLESQNTALKIVRERLSQDDVKATGVTVKLIYQLLRFLPNAEQQLKNIYKFVNDNRDIYVGINMVGREDNGKGHPLRFLSTLRELRQQYPAIALTIHAGEVDEPNSHIRDTLLLGADRIGHGVNLLGDPDTTLLMRHNHYLIEVNLISNLLLEYVDEFNQHPFPEFLRTGIPVALSTDDRGMFHSNLTDEFFVAVKTFNLSWSEIIKLSKNSINYSFLNNDDKQVLLNRLNEDLTNFTNEFKNKGKSGLKKTPILNQFIQRHYPQLSTK